MNTLVSEAYLAEIFSSFQGEGGTVRGSCFGKRQIFIRFYGCNIAEGAFDSNGCFWCDTPQSRKFKQKDFQYEKEPGSKELWSIKNPVDIKTVIQIVESLRTPDLQSISLTGGEPLCQLNFITFLLQGLEKYKIPGYLETNGTITPQDTDMKKLAKHIKFCCCDIKDESSRAASPDQWQNLALRELEFIETMISYGIETFAKLVVTSATSYNTIEWISEKLSKISYPNGEPVGLAIQPVTLQEPKQTAEFSVSNRDLSKMFQLAAKYLPPSSLSLSLQAHKYLNLL